MKIRTRIFLSMILIGALWACCATARAQSPFMGDPGPDAGVKAGDMIIFTFRPEAELEAQEDGLSIRAELSPGLRYVADSASLMLPNGHALLNIVPGNDGFVALLSGFGPEDLLIFRAEVTEEAGRSARLTVGYAEYELTYGEDAAGDSSEDPPTTPGAQPGDDPPSQLEEPAAPETEQEPQLSGDASQVGAALTQSPYFKQYVGIGVCAVGLIGCVAGILAIRRRRKKRAERDFIN